MKALSIYETLEWINHRPSCENCRDKPERSKFKPNEQKNNSYSNLIPGFSSCDIRKLSPPIDVLIVGETHGGGREEDFREQKDLDYEVKYISDYYLREELVKFHQQQMRELFHKLDELNKSWFFTDLVKCFVWKKDKTNIKIAIDNCSKYLDKQISSLEPEKILVLGRMVAEKYFGLKTKSSKHGKNYIFKFEEKLIPIVWSRFPSQITADRWIKEKAWGPVIGHFIE
jgi:hypothetical protein